MTGTQGIAPDGTRELLCGISYRQVIACAGMSQKEAAKRLGVAEDHFGRTMRRHHLTHWFTPRYERKRSVTADDIRQLAAEGYTQKDAAELAGISYSRFKHLVKEYELQDLFPNCGAASWISRRGYAK